MLIVDAYNVLHADGVLPPHLEGGGVPGLIRLLAASRYARRRITLVCDGGASGSRSGVRIDGVYVLYSGHEAEADDLIETLIEKYHRGNPLDVVSTDRRLRKAARRVGAGSIRSEDFLARLAEDEARPKLLSGNALRKQVPLDAYSVRAWCREFGVPEAEPETTETPVAPVDSPAREAPPAKPVRTKPPRRRAGPAASLGHSLGITLPNPPGTRPVAEPVPISDPIPESPPKSAPISNEPAPASLDEIDPLVLRALEEWRGRLDLDDLDMRRWMPDADPL